MSNPATPFTLVWQLIVDDRVLSDIDAAFVGSSSKIVLNDVYNAESKDDMINKFFRSLYDSLSAPNIIDASVDEYDIFREISIRSDRIDNFKTLLSVSRKEREVRHHKGVSMYCPSWPFILRDNSPNHKGKPMRAFTRRKHYKTCTNGCERYCNYILLRIIDPNYVDVQTPKDLQLTREIDVLQKEIILLKTKLQALKTSKNIIEGHMTKVHTLSHSIVSKYAWQQYRLLVGANVCFSDSTGQITISFDDILAVMSSLAEKKVSVS